MSDEATEVLRVFQSLQRLDSTSCVDTATARLAAIYKKANARYVDIYSLIIRRCAHAFASLAPAQLKAICSVVFRALLAHESGSLHELSKEACTYASSAEDKTHRLCYTEVVYFLLEFAEENMPQETELAQGLLNTLAARLYDKIVAIKKIALSACVSRLYAYQHVIPSLIISLLTLSPALQVSIIRKISFLNSDLLSALSALFRADLEKAKPTSDLRVAIVDMVFAYFAEHLTEEIVDTVSDIFYRFFLLVVTHSPSSLRRAIAKLFFRCLSKNTAFVRLYVTIVELHLRLILQEMDGTDYEWSFPRNALLKRHFDNRVFILVSLFDDYRVFLQTLKASAPKDFASEDTMDYEVAQAKLHAYLCEIHLHSDTSTLGISLLSAKFITSETQYILRTVLSDISAIQYSKGSGETLGSAFWFNTYIHFSDLHSKASLLSVTDSSNVLRALMNIVFDYDLSLHNILFELIDALSAKTLELQEPQGAVHPSVKLISLLMTKLSCVCDHFKALDKGFRRLFAEDVTLNMSSDSAQTTEFCGTITCLWSLLSAALSSSRYMKPDLLLQLRTALGKSASLYISSVSAFFERANTALKSSENQSDEISRLLNSMGFSEMGAVQHDRLLKFVALFRQSIRVLTVTLVTPSSRDYNFKNIIVWLREFLRLVTPGKSNCVLSLQSILSIVEMPAHQCCFVVQTNALDILSGATDLYTLCVSYNVYGLGNTPSMITVDGLAQIDVYNHHQELAYLLYASYSSLVSQLDNAPRNQKGPDAERHLEALGIFACKTRATLYVLLGKLYSKQIVGYLFKPFFEVVREAMDRRLFEVTDNDSTTQSSPYQLIADGTLVFGNFMREFGIRLGLCIGLSVFDETLHGIFQMLVDRMGDIYEALVETAPSGSNAVDASLACTDLSFVGFTLTSHILVSTLGSSETFRFAPEIADTALLSTRETMISIMLDRVMNSAAADRIPCQKLCLASFAASFILSRSQDEILQSNMLEFIGGILSNTAYRTACTGFAPCVFGGCLTTQEVLSGIHNLITEKLNLTIDSALPKSSSGAAHRREVTRFWNDICASVSKVLITI